MLAIKLKLLTVTNTAASTGTLNIHKYARGLGLLNCGPKL